jgi:hypothetical protein
MTSTTSLCQMPDMLLDSVARTTINVWSGIRTQSSTGNLVLLRLLSPTTQRKLQLYLVGIGVVEADSSTQAKSDKSGKGTNQSALIYIHERAAGISTMDRILCWSLAFRGDPPFLSGLKSISLTSCSTRTSATDTLTQPA